MKKLLLVVGMIGIACLMVLVLFHNKAEVEKKAKQTHNTAIPVSVIEVRQQKLQLQVTKVGQIVANNEVAVVSEASGRVVGVYANVGSYLGSGATIVRVDDELSRANLDSVKTSFTKAQKDYERHESLFRDGLISESQLESARLSLRSAEASFIGAQRQNRNSSVTTPISGVVTDRPVNLGAMVNAGTVVATVVDMSVFKVKVNVGETEAFKIRVGDGVTIESDVYPGVVFNGRIGSISGKSDEAHTFPVEVIVTNQKEHPLKSGIFGKVTFRLGADRIALTIPRESLVGSIKDPQVYVVEKGQAKLRNIVLGAEVNGFLEVTQGLREHEPIVVSGQDNLTENAVVSVTK